MRQFEIDDMVKAVAGDPAAQFRVARRLEILQWNQAKRSSALKLATPIWRDKKVIRAIYKEARRLTVETGVKHEVDHIVPIQARNVCGLHVEHNLRIITKVANTRKHSWFSDVDTSDQLEGFGLCVTSGKRLFKKALLVGKPIIAIGCGGVCYRITSYCGQLAVTVVGKYESPECLSVLIASESALGLIFVYSIQSEGLDH